MPLTVRMGCANAKQAVFFVNADEGIAVKNDLDPYFLEYMNFLRRDITTPELRNKLLVMMTDGPVDEVVLHGNTEIDALCPESKDKIMRMVSNASNAHTIDISGLKLCSTQLDGVRRVLYLCTSAESIDLSSNDFSEADIPLLINTIPGFSKLKRLNLANKNQAIPPASHASRPSGEPQGAGVTVEPME